MKKRKIILGLLVLVSLQTSFISCNKAEVKETRIYSVTMDGEKKYISEDSKEFKEIEEFAKLFISYGVESNYKDKSYLKEIELFEESVRETLQEMDYENETKNYIEGNEIIIKVNNYEIKKAELHNTDGKESAKVYIDYNYKYEHATAEFVEDFEIEIGKNIDKSVYLDLIKQDGEWKSVSSGIIE